MKLIKKIFLIIVLSIIANPAFAKISVNDLISSWGSPTMLTCFAQGVEKPCVGNSLKDSSGNCLNWLPSGNPAANRGTESNQGATLLMVARKVIANGGYFCVTQVQAANKNKNTDAWTTYYEPSGGTTSCVWLCKSGYYGSGCTQTTPSSCDSTTLLRSNFDGYKLATSGSTNIENDIPRFFDGTYRSCGLRKEQEHDMILAISGWTTSGHGAFAQPMLVRAERTSGMKDVQSTITLKTGTSTPVLLCKNGYKSNAAGTDCEVVNNNLCTMNSLCSGWTKTSFNNTLHTLKEINGCYQYRCVQSGFAFASDTDKTCTACSGDARVGIPDDTGVCVKCPKGEIFDNDNSTNKYCSKAKVLSTQDLIYGSGKNQQTTTWGDQCWLIIEPSEYRDCVLNTPATTTAK